MQPLIHVKIDFFQAKFRLILKLFLLFSLSSSLVPLFSSLAAAVAPPPAFDKLISNYKELNGFSSDFTQAKKLTAIGMELKGRGQLQVYQDHSIIWKVVEPAPLEVRINSKEIAVTTTVGGKDQKQVYSLTEGVAGNQIAASVKPFLDLFSGSSSVLANRFQIEQGSDGYVLTPQETSKEQVPIEKLALVPDPSGQYIARITIYEKSGDSIEYRFEKPVALVQK